MKPAEEVEVLYEKLKTYKSRDELKIAIKATPDLDVLKGLRSGCWKLFLLFNSPDASVWAEQLDGSRDLYSRLCENLIDNVTEDEYDDPLSDSVESRWSELRKDEALRKLIEQDVERCMVDNAYFRKQSTQKSMTDILFVWSKLNHDTSYRQGMHDILAMIMRVVWGDAINPKSLQVKYLEQNQPDVQKIFDKNYVEHDSYALFEMVMKYVKVAYEQVSVPTPTSGKPGLITPNEGMIVKRSERIMNNLVARVDARLAQHIRSIGIPPQIFLLRWIRVLFGREFDFDDTLGIWDRIFAETPINGCIIDYVCVVMLLRIRWDLLECDTNGALALLLHYPGPSASLPAYTLVEDALYLKDNLNPEGGMRIIGTRTPPPLSPPSAVRQQSAMNTALGQPVLPFASLGARSAESPMQKRARKLYESTQELADQLRDQFSRKVPGRPLSHSDVTFPVLSTDDHTSPSEELVQQIESFADRNKQLAKMLETATDTIWEQHKNVNKTTPTLINRENVLVAMAKAQLIGRCLEDPSCEMPTEEEVINTVLQQDMDLQAESGILEPAPPYEDEVQEPTATIVMSNTPESSKQLSGEASSSITSTLKQGPRPRITDPSFSWILDRGQDPGSSSSAQNTFMSSTSPFSMPAEKRSSKRNSLIGNPIAFLLGDDHKGGQTSPPAPPRHRSKGKGKEKANAQTEDVNEAFNLGALNLK